MQIRLYFVLALPESPYMTWYLGPLKWGIPFGLEVTWYFGRNTLAAIKYGYLSTMEPPVKLTYPMI
jgi:hypothetical protein